MTAAEILHKHSGKATNVRSVYHGRTLEAMKEFAEQECKERDKQIEELTKAVNQKFGKQVNWFIQYHELKPQADKMAELLDHVHANERTAYGDRIRSVLETYKTQIK